MIDNLLDDEYAKAARALLGSTAVRIANDFSAKATGREANDYKRVLALTKISDKWVLGLPKRKDAGSLEDAWIPNIEARKAGEPLGVVQNGIGSGN